MIQLSEIRGLALFTLLLVIVISDGCRTKPPVSSSATEIITSPPVLVVGDSLRLVFRRDGAELRSVEATIQADGNISLPYAGTIAVAGKTCAQVGLEVDTAFRNCWRTLDVTVNKLER